MMAWSGFPIAALVIDLVFWATIAQAETIKVRAGDHAEFTRLVVDLTTNQPWQLRRADGGYELRLSDKNTTFETRSVFDRVGRKRISDVGPAGLPGALALAVDCDCHATAFTTDSGQIVIDIVDGPPQAGSPFEETYPESVTAGDSAVTRSVQPSHTATISFKPVLDQAASLPVFWRDLAEDAARPTPSQTVEGAAADAMSLPQPVPANAKESSENTLTLPLQMPLIDTPAVTKSPAPADTSSRVDQAEAEILHQLARAASQGLVTIKPPPKKHDEPILAKPISDDVAASQMMRRHLGAGSELPPLAFQAQTSLDRDGPAGSNDTVMTLEGAACLPDADIDFAKWGDARPATAQISEKRAHLTGEFDKPNIKEIVEFAKLNLYFGFGAEARQVLLAFPMSEGEPEPVLLDLGSILEGDSVPAGSPLHAMRECGNNIALWAFLAAPSPDDVRTSEVDAVVRSFSALPAAVRYLLAQRVSTRLVQIGAPEAARSVRNAVARMVDQQDRVVGLLDAEIAIEHGDVEAADAEFEQIAKGNDALAIEAAIRSIETRIDRGEAIDSKKADTIAALAFEYRTSSDGAKYAHLEVLARAAAGDFSSAFDSYERWKESSPDANRSVTARKLFGLLTSKATDGDFLSGYFGHKAILAEAGSDVPAELELADRLMVLGFATEVRDVLSQAAAATERGRVQLAKAALGLFDPEDALQKLSGLQGKDVLLIRADAQAMLGNHTAEADALAQAGAIEDAGEAAWRAGIFDRVEAGPERLRKTAVQLGLDKKPKSATLDAPLTIAASKATLQGSAAMRATLTELLNSENNMEK